MIAATKYRAINLQESIHVPCRRRHVLCPALCTQLIRTFHLSLFVSYFNNLKRAIRIARNVSTSGRSAVEAYVQYCLGYRRRRMESRPNKTARITNQCGGMRIIISRVRSLPAFFFYHSCWHLCMQRTDLLPALQPVEYRPAEGCNVDQSNISTRTWLGAWDYIPVAGGYPDGWVRENDS